MHANGLVIKHDSNNYCNRDVQSVCYTKKGHPVLTVRTEDGEKFTER